MFYDLIEFLQPITINLKITFRKLCKLELSSDEDIPKDLEWLEALYFLEEVVERTSPECRILLSC